MKDGTFTAKDVIFTAKDMIFTAKLVGLAICANAGDGRNQNLIAKTRKT